MILDKVNLIENESNLKGKTVILRTDFNVPIEDGKIMDDYRIVKSLKTINFLIENGCKIIIFSHLGKDGSATLKPVYEYLNTRIPITFTEDVYDSSARKLVDDLPNGHVILFENIRQYSYEKENDFGFAKLLASFGDIFVNDAFSVSHREHASIIGIPKFIKGYMGFQMAHEIRNLSKAFNPEKPFTFILGGAKVETKLPLLYNFIDKADDIFVGGVLANDFLKAKGFNVGKSRTSDQSPDLKILDNGNIHLPTDVVISRNSAKFNLDLKDVYSDDLIYDLGEKSINKITESISNSKMVVWNGPLGFCEEGFCDGTYKVAEILAEKTNLGQVFSIIGGGDSVAAIPEEYSKKFSFVSTGGGAMLDFLSNETLPGIDALV